MVQVVTEGSVFIAQLMDGNSVCHQCSLLFTSAGLFQVVVRCRAQVPQQDWTCMLTVKLH